MRAVIEVKISPEREGGFDRMVAKSFRSLKNRLVFDLLVPLIWLLCRKNLCSCIFCIRASFHN